jgi:hypothetical protein
MSDTVKNASRKPDDTRRERTQPTGLKPSEGKPSAESYQLANLSLRTAKRLEDCMEKISGQESVEAVKAVCMCAGELNKLMRLNLEFYKEGL